ncbi:MAG: DUF2442 domain-containing protein [Thermoguttaceae bacterium]
MRRIVEVHVLEDYRLKLTFDDGISGTVDVSDLAGKGVFGIWCERQTFESVRIGPSGELVWSDQVDLCPDALYLKATGKRPEDLFPALRNEPAHA